jgi:hypothetical protein
MLVPLEFTFRHAREGGHPPTTEACNELTGCGALDRPAEPDEDIEP